MLEKNVQNRNQVEIICIEDLVPQDHLLRKIESVVDFKKIYDFERGLNIATALGESPGDFFSDTSSIPVISTKQVLDEHLLFQRRLCC